MTGNSASNLIQSVEGYLKKCRAVFEEYRSRLSKVIPFPTSSENIKPFREHLDNTIAVSEKSEEFDVFVNALEKGPLSDDLKKIRLKEERQRAKAKKKAQASGREIQFRDIDRFCHDTSRQAAQSFLKNTGLYQKLWTGMEVDAADLAKTLEAYGKDQESEYIRLFVFDGFVPCDGQRSLDRIELPQGELRKFEEKELEDLLRLPQTAFHGIVNAEIPRSASIWHILVAREKTGFSGFTGIWFGDKLISRLNWSDIGEVSAREADVGLIGPIFICIGEEANLAAEIRIRTNVFESVPAYEHIRNGYLPWDSYDEDGDPQPRTYINDIGEGGKKLIKINQLWHRLNGLADGGRLRFATETYVRSVMNLHVYSDNAMEIFVGFVTAIESLLTPGFSQELTYKIAMRGAALLSSNPRHRLKLVELFNDCYRVRSKIVHEGHAGSYDSTELRDLISYRLSEVARQIFLRYMSLVAIADEGSLPTWIQNEINKLKLKKNLANLATCLLDAIVLDPKLITLLEEKMDQWDLHEDWIQKSIFRFKFGE